MAQASHFGPWPHVAARAAETGRRGNGQGPPWSSLSQGGHAGRAEAGAPTIVDPRWLVFLQVSASGSLSRAAAALDMPQSMVSRNIAQLEQQCCERLFRRTGRGVVTRCSAVTIPRYSADLKRLNERGIRHDIELAMEFGFRYTLLCSEVAIRPEENAQFTAWTRETAGNRLGLFSHTAFGTLAENINAVKLAERAGADIVLLLYAPQFWPTTEQEIEGHRVRTARTVNATRPSTAPSPSCPSPSLR